jgi:cytochrome P450
VSKARRLMMLMLVLLSHLTIHDPLFARTLSYNLYLSLSTLTLLIYLLLHFFSLTLFARLLRSVINCHHLRAPFSDALIIYYFQCKRLVSTIMEGLVAVEPSFIANISAALKNDPVSSFFTFLICFVTAIVIYILSLCPIPGNPLRYSYPSDVPGVEGGRNWIVGTLLWFINNFETLPESVTAVSKKLNYATWGGPVPSCGLGNAVFVCTKNECVKHILKDNFENYEKGENFNVCLNEFLGDGIFSTDGALWKNHRKIASKMFTNNLMKAGTALAMKQTALLVQRLDSLKPEEGIDMQEMFFKLTIDVFSAIAFGVELDSIKSDEVHPFAAAFDEVQQHCAKRFKDPVWKIKRNFQLSDGERKIRAGAKVIDQFAADVIADKRRDVVNGTNMGPDLLSRFLEADPNTKTKELRDIVMNFMIAGRDTTACALSWIFYELTKHPDVLQKCLDEIDSVFANKDKGKEEEDDDANGKKIPANVSRNYEALSNCSYLHAVAMETLRLHPR